MANNHVRNHFIFLVEKFICVKSNVQAIDVQTQESAVFENFTHQKQS